MKRIFLTFLMMLSGLTITSAQVISYTPNLNLAQPPPGYNNWAYYMNNNMSILDLAFGSATLPYQGLWSSTTTYGKGVLVTYLGNLYASNIGSNLNNNPVSSGDWTQVASNGSMVYPPAGIGVSTGASWGSAATYATIVGLWTACGSGYLRFDGTCSTPSGAAFPSSPASGLMFYTSPTAGRAGLYTDVTALWASGSCSGFLKSDGTCSTPSGASFPSSPASGVMFYTSPTAGRAGLYTDIVSLWASGSCSGYLKNDGTCSTPGGGGGGGLCAQAPRVFTTNDTLVLTDATVSGNPCIGTNIGSSASNITETIPPHSSVAFSTPSEIDVIQGGAGQVCFTGGTIATGTVNTSGTAVTWASGNTFSTGTAWTSPIAFVIAINGTSYNIASVGSTTSMTLATSAGTQTGVSYTVAVQLLSATSVCARAQQSTIGIRQLGQDEWQVFGDLQ